MSDAGSAPTRFTGPTCLLDGTGTLLGPTPWRALSQRDVDMFAGATGDYQWIHVDAARAAAGPFGTTIAHGYLTLALAGVLVPQLLGVADSSSVINYGCDRVRVLSPVGIPAELRARGTIASASAISGGVQVAVQIAIELKGAARPACIVTSVLRYLE